MKNIEDSLASNMSILKLSALDLARIREHDLLFFDTLSGSHSYGTNTDQSDEDYRGLFIMPSSFHAGLESIEQVADEKNDQVYYELTRFFQLLAKNNPTALELLYAPQDCIRYQHPAFSLIKRDSLLSKLCEQSFAGYAVAQIKKARGLNKKIMSPEPEQRKHLRDFCFILEGQGSQRLAHWLEDKGLEEKDCGLVAVNHAPGTYALFHSKDENYRGIFSPKDDAAMLCSSVPLEAKPIAWIACNLDAFKAHCRSHREYWEWVSKRNENRYQTNASHGRGYDSKNMMHTLRLLDMAFEIATEEIVRVRRPNSDWLLRVKNGDYEYEELLSLAEQRLEDVKAAFAKSKLPDSPDRNAIARNLLIIQEAFYSNG